MTRKCKICKELEFTNVYANSYKCKKCGTIYLKVYNLKKNRDEILEVLDLGKAHEERKKEIERFIKKQENNK